MSRWVGVVQHTSDHRKRVGETLVNLDRVCTINVAENRIYFDTGSITVNEASMKHLLDIVETE